MPSAILKRHPRLRTSRDSERSAAWLELFFDLVFVLAVAELALYLRDHLSPGGFLGFAGLFVPVWWTWICFSFYADQFDPDDVVYRLVMLVAMLLSIVLAVSIPGALSVHVVIFVAMYVALQVLVIGLYVWGRRDPSARWLCTRFAIGLTLGAGLWLVSLWLSTPARYSIWALALLVEIGTPFIVSLNLTGRIYYVSHIPERLGVFTLIVLGEAIVQVGASLVGTRWQASSILTAIGSFIIAACLWWIYFDRIDFAVVDRALTKGKWEMVRSYSWSYIHLAFYAGLTATSAGIALAIAASPGRLDNGPRIALCGGIAVAVLAMSLIQQLGPRRLSRSELFFRLAASIAALLLALFGMALPSLAVVGLLALFLVIITVYEVVFYERSRGDAENMNNPGAEGSTTTSL